MSKQTNYVAKKPDTNGIVHYTDEENQVWHDLITRQVEIVKNRACDEYIEGVRLLNFSHERIPQLHEVNAVLQKTTGWSVQPVAALISFDRFFELLANRQFPAATFIRTREDFDYIQEPDIFHEFFGHCPMLTEPVYADFMQKYGKLGLAANPKDRVLLARLYWFTVEFGLIKTSQGPRIYGGGILSSKTETVYAVESPIPQRNPLGNGLDPLRTPYRIDILQPIYYVINNYQQLYDLVDNDLIALINQSRELGQFPPLFPPKEEN